MKRAISITFCTFFIALLAVAQGDAVQEHQRAAAPPLDRVDRPAIGCRDAVVDHIVGEVEEVVGQRGAATTGIGAQRAASAPRMRGAVGTGCCRTDADEGGAQEERTLGVHDGPPR